MQTTPLSQKLIAPEPPARKESSPTALSPSLELIRIVTIGNVDDGKSTLMGRLLYDTHSLYDDQARALENEEDDTENFSQRLNEITDGLKAEREQGITIDVAYRYFQRNERRFILADAPGHVQYTRNMVTAASTAHMAILLVDGMGSRENLQEQTKRHTMLSALLRVPYLVVCINKMDLLAYDQAAFTAIKERIENEILAHLKFSHVTFIPISALHGDGVVVKSSQMSWYKGPTLCEVLETVAIPHSLVTNDRSARLSVQNVLQKKGSTQRVYAGKVLSGHFSQGDHIRLYPGNHTSTITAITQAGRPVTAAVAPLSVGLEIKDDYDVSRGTLITGIHSPPIVAKTFNATLCLLQSTKLQSGLVCLLKHHTQTVQVRISSILAVLTEDKFEELPYDESTASSSTTSGHSVFKVTLETSLPLFFDTYEENRQTGCFILIDTVSFETIAAGLIL